MTSARVDTHPSASSLTKTLRLKYIGALILVASAAAGGHVLLTTASDASRRDAAAINIAGRQRMLSQRIALLAHNIAHHDEQSEIASDRVRLQATLAQLTTSHQDLIKGNPMRGVAELDDPELLQLFGEIEVLLNRIESATSALLAADHDPHDSADAVDQAASQFLPKMDAIVQGFEDQAESHVGSVILIGRALFVAIICLLLLEAVLVFEPAVRTIHRRTRALLKATGDAQAASRAKSSFLANVSHEIRTPMNAIVGYAQLLEHFHKNSDDSSKRERDAITSIRVSSNELLGLINNVLELHDLAEMPPSVQTQATSIGELTKGIKRLVDEQLADHGNTFTVTISDLVPDSVILDPFNTERILIHLISNSNKFTKLGMIRLDVDVDEDSAAEVLSFTVTDSGSGIPAKYAHKVFDPFSQADDSSTKKHAGLGLGLAVSRHYATAMNGKLELVSTSDEGSTFCLTLPITSTNQEPIPLRSMDSTQAVSDGLLVSEIALPASDTPDRPELIVSEQTPGAFQRKTLEGMRVLVAEDNFLNADLAYQNLSAIGAHPTLVNDGKAALEAWRSSSKDQFDIIILDIQMPVMDGFTAAAELRKSGCDLPIIALTAYARRSERDQCIEAGCDAVITKPIDPAELFTAITTQHAHASSTR